MLCQARNPLKSRKTLWKYKKSFDLLHTLQKFVIFAFTSFHEKGESVLTAAEKRREGCIQGTMLLTWVWQLRRPLGLVLYLLAATHFFPFCEASSWSTFLLHQIWYDIRHSRIQQLHCSIQWLFIIIYLYYRNSWEASAWTTPPYAGPWINTQQKVDVLELYIKRHQRNYGRVQMHRHSTTVISAGINIPAI